MKLTRKKLIQLKKTKSEFLEIRNGFALAINDSDDCIVYKTDLPDCVIDLLEFKKIIQFLKNPEFEIKDYKLVIKQGDEKFFLDTYDRSVSDRTWKRLDDYGEELCTVSKDELKSYEKFTSSDNLRQTMHNVYFGKMGVAATDAHTLMFDTDVSYNEDVLIPKDLIKCLTDDVYELHANALVGDEQIILLKNRDDNFPNITSVIPNHKKFFTISKDEIYNSIKIISKMWSGNGYQDNLYINSETIKLISDGDEVYEKEINGENSNFQAELNPDYLLKILKDIDDENIEFNYGGRKRAIIINNRYLIMPIVR